MSDDPYRVDDREHPHHEDVADDVQMLDLLWRTGHALYDMLIWLRDHSDGGDASAAWGEEADVVAGAMEDAAVADLSAQWRVYGRFAVRRDEVERIIEHQLAQH